VPSSRASALALVGGLSVRAAAAAWLAAAGQKEAPLVKWPNDVLVGGRKLCGILAESQVRGSEVVAVALGIGLNVGRGAVPTELAATATSLEDWGVSNQGAERSIADVLAALEPRVDAFLVGAERIVSEFREHDALLGRAVVVDGLKGVCRGINRSGSLLLEDEQGVLRDVISGHVQVTSS
jgi:BirA family biotin operon repressor/biotin-[acetyl-CoA-carboxylase] ligase